MRSKKEFLYVFASVLLSFVLFINASSFNFQNNSSARQVSSETYTNTLTNIPIDAKYNDKKYFVSGLTSEVTVPDNQIVDGITVTDISLETTKVEVTSDQETLSRIDHVQAVFPSSEIISGNYSGTISLNAVDAQGNILPGLVNPSETRIQVTTKTSSSTSSSSSSSSTSSSSSN